MPPGDGIEVIRTPNRGYGAAANVGFARANELGADGYQSRKVRFRVTAGETKPLDIVLEKE